jgi:hypothetical protein
MIFFAVVLERRRHAFLADFGQFVRGVISQHPKDLMGRLKIAGILLPMLAEVEIIGNGERPV